MGMWRDIKFIAVTTVQELSESVKMRWSYCHILIVYTCVYVILDTIIVTQRA